MKYLLSILALAGFACAQTFGTCNTSNGCITAITSDSAHIVGTISQDGWVQISLGTQHLGPYTTVVLPPWCNNSPEVVISDATGTGAQLYVSNLSSGVPIIVSVLYGGGSAGGGTNYTAPTASLVDRCVLTGDSPGSGGTIGLSLNGGSIVSPTITGGSGYHGQNTGSIIGQGLFAYGTHSIIESVGTLAPSTTYYGIFTYYPDENDRSGAVSSSEFSFTTTAACAGPCLPTLPQGNWNPASPANHPAFPTTGCTDFPYSGTPCYHVIPIAFNSGKNECAATSAVGPIAYGGTAPGPTAFWMVNNGDTIQTILSEVGSGAILDIAQGSQCLIPTGFQQCSNSSPDYAGNYKLCVINTDPAAASIDDPAHRWIVIRTHQNAATDFPPTGFRFNPNNTRWASNIAAFVTQLAQGTLGNGEGLFADEAYSANFPVHHYWVENIELKTNGSTGAHATMFRVGAGTNNNYSALNPPLYIVADRIWINAPVRTDNTTFMWRGFNGSPGGHWSLTNSYLGQFDDTSAVSQSVYLTDCGSGPGIIDNNFLDGIGENIYIEANSPPYCSSPAQVATVFAPASQSVQTNIRSYTDVTITHNAAFEPLTTMNGYPTWDGFTRAAVRNEIEEKNCLRCLIQGNVINGEWSGQTLGEAIAVATGGTAARVGTNGSQHVTIRSNLITNSAMFVSFEGTRTLQNNAPPDAIMNSNILVNNNYAYNIGKNMFPPLGCCGAVGEGGYFATGSCPQDLTIWGNSLAVLNGDEQNAGASNIPSWISVGGPSLCGGFTQQNNILGFSGSSFAPIIINADQPGCCLSIMPAKTPALVPTNSSTMFQSAFVQQGISPIQSAYTINHNIVIPGWYAGAETPWTEMTDAQSNAFKVGNPTGDTYITGASLAAHIANAGVANLQTGNPTCVPTTQHACNAGVNLQALEAALGIVSQIFVSSGQTALQFSYLAPDSRSCHVETSPDGVTWTSTPDSGGSRPRTLLVTGLTANTAYQYALECYFYQSVANAPFLYNGSTSVIGWDSSNLITDGVSATTAANGTRTLPESYTALTGEASRVFTLTPIGASALAPVTCTSSPCSIASVPNGGYSVSYVAKNSGGATIASGSFSANQ